MDNNGYIKLYRSILKWEWWDDINTTRVFIWLLLNAQWEDFRYRGYEVPRGSLVIGRNRMSKELRMSEQSIRTSLNHLKSTNEITIQSTNKFSLVTIVNWDKYQGKDDENNQQTNQQINQQLTNNQPTTNHIIRNKEYKNIRREEYSVADCESVQNLFNDICVKYPPCRNLTKTRLDKVRNLLSEFSLDDIKEVFTKANGSDYLLGINDRGWRAGFDWLIEVDNFVKVQDGNFDNRESKKDIYHSYIKGNYDFEALERETREPKRQHYDFEAIDKEIREK